jgi:hypothetical protein
MFGGMQIVAHPWILPQALLQLHPDVVCSDAFRAEMNRWLLETFGKRDVAYIVDTNYLDMGNLMYAGEKVIFANPRVVAALNGRR